MVPLGIFFFPAAQYLLKNVRNMLLAEVSTPNFSEMCKFSSEKNLQTCVKVKDTLEIQYESV